MTLIDFKKDFFENRNINWFDGRMITKYKLTDSEFQDLFNIFFGNYFFLSNEYSPFFILLACELWKREWKGGYYSWDFIFNRLNVNPEYEEKTRVTKLGFHYCNRALRRSIHSTRYLGSIIAEAGIPNSIINTDGNNLLSLIKKAYKISIASSIVIDVEFLKTIAEDVGLPNIYQNDDIYELIIEIVTGLHELNDTHNLSEHQNPISYLNEKHPNWDENLPITITEANTTFYNTLLSDVAKIAVANGGRKLKVEYYLKNNGYDLYSIDFELLNQNRLVDPRSLGLSEKDLESLGVRFDMVEEVGEQRIIYSSFTRVNNGKLRQIKTDSRLLPHYDENIRFYVTNGEYIADINIWSYSFLDQREPIVFVEKEGRYLLSSTGSSRLKNEDYKLLVPKYFECEFENFGESLDFKESEKYALYNVSGNTWIKDGQGTEYKIETGIEEFSHFYQLKKKESNHFPILKDKNQNLSIGCPSLCQYNKSGMLKKCFHGSELEYYHNGTWLQVNPRLLGRKKIRKVINGETVFSSWVNLIPENLEIAYRHAEVMIKNLNGYFRVPSDISNDVVLSPDSIQFRNPSLKKVFKLEVIPNDLGKSIFINLPSSFDPVYLLDADNELVPEHADISLRSMSNYSLCFFNKLNTRKELDLRLKLNCKVIKSNNLFIDKKIVLEPTSNLQHGLINLRDDIELLFSLTNNHDAIIKVTISNFSFDIKQYEFNPQLAKNVLSFPYRSNVLGIRLDDTIRDNCVEEFKVDYEGNYESKDNGLWLYFPGSGSEVYFRPVLESLSECRAPSQYSMGSISLYSDYDDRAKRLKEFFRKHLVDFGSPVWKELDSLSKISNANNLPLSTFDVFRVLSKSPKLLPYLMLRMSPEIIWKFTREFSIIWNVVKVPRWIEALKSYNSYLVGLGVPITAVIGLINSKLEEISDVYRLKELSHYLRETIIMDRAFASNYNVTVFQNELNRHFNGAEGEEGLRVRHLHSDEWPHHNLESLNRLVAELEREYHFRPRAVGFTNGMEQVYFLPMVFAYLSLKEDEHLEELVEIENRFHILQTIDFDSEWFNDLFNLATKFFLSQNN